MGKGNAANQKIAATDFTKFRLLRKSLKVLDRSGIKRNVCFGDDGGSNDRIVYSCHGLQNFWMGVMQCGEDVGVEEVQG